MQKYSKKLNIEYNKNIGRYQGTRKHNAEDRQDHVKRKTHDSTLKATNTLIIILDM